jgi:hypothetical protein
MDAIRKEILLSMHKFYSDGSNRELTMMWETVKWFTPILTLIAGGIVKYSVDFLACKNGNLAIAIIACSFFGLLLSTLANFLLEKFYRVNMQYVTMYVKVEDELDFDKRQIAIRHYYLDDEFITWKGYIEERTDNATGANVVVKQVNLATFGANKKFPYIISQNASICNYMKLVFFLFILFFALMILFVIYFWLK